MFKYLKITIVFYVACSPSLEKEWDWNDSDESAYEIFDSGTDLEDGEIQTVFRRQIDATDYDNWVLLNLETGLEYMGAELSDHDNWDLAIQRFNFALNCPLNGTGNVSAQTIFDVNYSDYIDIPTDGFEQDEADSDSDGIPEYVLGDWYDYDPSTHILTPKEQFYVIQTRNQNHVKFQIEDYYSSAGTSAMITVSWEILDPIETTATH